MATSFPQTLARLVASAALAFGLANAVHAVAGAAPPAGEGPGNGLNIPPNVQLFATADPNVRKPTAVVNGDIITGTDVEQRLALILAANDNKLAPEETQRVIAAIQADGTCWAGGTVWQGRTAMRISVCSWATTEADVDASVAAMLRARERAA